jgi:hypothetical protein
LGSLNKLPVIIFALLLAACTSNSDKIYIATSGGQAASCRLANGVGAWKAPAPGSISIKKSASDLKISCANRQANLAGSRVIKSDEAGDYPAEVVIKLAKKKPNKAGDVDDSEDLTPLNRLPEAPPGEPPIDEKADNKQDSL